MADNIAYTYEEVAQCLDGHTIQRTKNIQYLMRKAFEAWKKDSNTEKYHTVFQKYIFTYFKRYVDEKGNGIKVVHQDSYDALERAFDSVRNAIALVVTQETKRRVKETEQAYQKRITELQEELKDVAKKSNLRYMLQRAWGGA